MTELMEQAEYLTCLSRAVVEIDDRKFFISQTESALWKCYAFVSPARLEPRITSLPLVFFEPSEKGLKCFVNPVGNILQ